MACYEAQIEIGLDAGAVWENSNAASPAPDGNGVRGWSIWPDVVNVGYSQTPINTRHANDLPTEIADGIVGGAAHLRRGVHARSWSKRRGLPKA